MQIIKTSFVSGKVNTMEIDVTTLDTKNKTIEIEMRQWHLIYTAGQLLFYFIINRVALFF